MECGGRKWAEPGTEVAAVVLVSCAAWAGAGSKQSSRKLLEGVTLEAAQPRVLQGALGRCWRGSTVSAWENQEMT